MVMYSRFTQNSQCPFGRSYSGVSLAIFPAKCALLMKNQTGAKSVSAISNSKKYSPQGSTELIYIPQRVHSTGMYRNMLYLLATSESLALRNFSLYKFSVSSSVAIFISTAHRIHTCARGPLPWMNWSREKVPRQYLHVGILLPHVNGDGLDSSSIRLKSQKCRNNFNTIN